MLLMTDGMYDARKQTTAAAKVGMGCGKWVVLSDDEKFTIGNIVNCPGYDNWKTSLQIETVLPVHTRPVLSFMPMDVAQTSRTSIEDVRPGNTYAIGPNRYLICDDVTQYSANFTIFRTDLVLKEARGRLVAQEGSPEQPSPAAEPIEAGSAVPSEQAAADFERRLSHIWRLAGTTAESLNCMMDMTTKLIPGATDQDQARRAELVRSAIYDAMVILRSVCPPLSE